MTLLYGFHSMPSKAKPRFVVLYGSQKGQAQSIAEGIAEEAEEHGLVASLSCLNQNEKVHASNITWSRVNYLHRVTHKLHFGRYCVI